MMEHIYRYDFLFGGVLIAMVLAVKLSPGHPDSLFLHLHYSLVQC